jgi:hypothetical protein
MNNEMISYIQHKKGLSYYYDKRKVLDDGVSNVPQKIEKKDFQKIKK